MDFAYFAERIAEPKKDNPYFYSEKNPYIKKGYGLPNCTCYACGRFAELHGEFVNELAYGNAENWYDMSRLEKGQEPRLGAIMCWRKGKVKNQNDGAGHVAVVEQIQGNGSITVSQSNYSGTVFKRRTFTKNNYSLGSAYTFQGFLYPKKAFVKASLGPVPRDTTVTQAQIDTVSLRFRPEPSTDSFSYGTLFTGYYPVLEQTENEGRTWVKINDRGFDAWAALDPSWGRILLPETDDEVVRLRKLLTEIKKIVEKM